jgi:hypothetical protein
VPRHPRFVGGILVGAVFVAVLVIGAVTFGRPAAGIYAVTSLPDQVAVCGRSYSRDTTNRPWSLAQVTDAGPGFPPVIVDPGLLARLFDGCQPGACTRSADGPCATVVWVRVDADAYVAYELQGGP